ncbi:MAG: cytochrome c peroxidase [Cytophagales bacterium]|nr:cytochrome c peroxidase [Cytophagales bacterium]
MSLLHVACFKKNLPESPQTDFNAPLRPYQLQIPDYFSRNFRIPDDNPLTEQGVELGRMLFYDTRLSSDNSVSCASCHQQSAAFSDNNRFSKGVEGRTGTRNSMSLANLLWVNRFFWDGRATSLESQALFPLGHPDEMNLPPEQAAAKLQTLPEYPPRFKQVFGSEQITPLNIAKALAQFQRTLISANSRYDRYLRGEYRPTALELQGIQLFFTHPIPEIGLRGGNCGDCHVGPLVQGDPTAFRGFHNNGLDPDATLAPGLQNVTGNPNDRGKFRAVSLRNIALTAPYMHDGRFQTLEQVLEHYDQHIQMSRTLDPLIIEASNEIRNDNNAPVKLYLTPQEKRAILAFLHMLTDSTFIQDKRFSNPFINR